MQTIDQLIAAGKTDAEIFYARPEPTPRNIDLAALRVAQMGGG